MELICSSCKQEHSGGGQVCIFCGSVSAPTVIFSKEELDTQSKQERESYFDLIKMLSVAAAVLFVLAFAVIGLVETAN